MNKYQREPPHLPKDCHHCPVRESTVCSAMREDQLALLKAFKTCDRILPARAHLYRTGEHPHEIYNLLSGWVTLYRILPSGKRQVLEIAAPGAFLGYQARLGDPMLHSAECSSDVTVCVFPRRTFPVLLEQHPAIGRKLLELIADDVVRGQDQLTNMGGRFGLERVAYFLLQLHLYQHRRRDTSDENSLDVPLTQQMIGDALGITAVHINRILRDLRERRLASLHRGTLHMLDLEGLRRLSEESQRVP
jgi:CRP-like cAMP-binding protein